MINKINSNDFTHHLKNTQLELNFVINNGNSDVEFTMCLEEFFLEDAFDEANIPDNLKEKFMNLQNKVNYLNAKLTEALDNLYDLEFKHRPKYCSNGYPN